MVYFYLENFNMEGSILSSIESEGKKILSGVEEEGEKTFINIKDKLKEGSKSKIVKKVEDGVSSEGKDIVKKVEDGVSNVFGKDIVKKIEEGVSSLGSGAKNIIKDVENPEKIVGDVIKTIADPKKIIKEIEVPLNKEVDVITEKINKNVVKPVVDEVKEVSTQVVDHTIDKVKNASEEIVKKIEENIVKPSIHEAENSANRIVKKTAKTFSSTIRSLIGPIWDWLKWVVLALGVFIVILIITSLVHLIKG